LISWETEKDAPTPKALWIEQEQPHSSVLHSRHADECRCCCIEKTTRKSRPWPITVT